jgi:hypothetical protein
MLVHLFNWNCTRLTIQVLSKSFETEDPMQPVWAIRKIRHQKAEKHLFLAHKNASLKSGARGLQARKDLKAAEGKLEATSEMSVASIRAIDYI